MYINGIVHNVSVNSSFSKLSFFVLLTRWLSNFGLIVTSNRLTELSNFELLVNEFVILLILIRKTSKIKLFRVTK